MSVKKWCIAVIAILLVTNGLTLGLLMMRNSSQDKLSGSGKAWEAFMLNGKSQHWQVNHFMIIRTASSTYRGKGSLTYLGAPGNIQDSTYFSYSFYEQPANETPQAVLSHTESSINGSVSLLDNTKEIASIQGAPYFWELEETKEDLGYSYMEMSWKDNQGNMHTEKIPMSVTEEYESME
ncbi:hypothetical protein J23TS9_44200 [Paenibacillus sp. J23TS9]|uniref:hypothetical protein n=1 Tax=Paenibacillus sp. J23TS9 TaxID=2807193 RepID=UPI001B1A646B|nr:hypothetical protein [Paenibacillus sp. J23TS9]GIP29290.1 hypothetical protein J23TS9_44200 [Paenibacillus sp. J23TS9]